ncbi:MULTISPECIES: helix-turn-helix domain-containing protein [Glycomyces]|uniref:AraC-like DNA-binding protein n=2 Tax=Glycomyces TaxID=58113 RepID=A0A9X3PIN3_9ACTN|nr:helix-turn-helix transcriptional regulator [Glycomyces lechevalierae]MDA1385975.1 helix-turn-helix transcriptional regulator [Glycomyces lechevalierae]MDR7340868.1 AraC-like DNA-binding protein [Glycomyces lechevalierae]
MQRVRLHLDQPPEVVGAGIAVHGLTTAEDRFRLPELWQLHLFDYEADLWIGGTHHLIRPGHISLIPAGVEARFLYRGPSQHLYLHLRLSERGRTVETPAMRDAGPAAPALADVLRRAITAAPDAPAQASAEAWAALWRIVRLPSSEHAGGSPQAVTAALAHIEQHLPLPITVPEIAAAVGLSHNHLTRLFHAATGTTVVAHIRRRRLERAGHLLRESTLSIPAIAAAVGIPDLQAFNKACRRELGASPRALRKPLGSDPPAP